MISTPIIRVFGAYIVVFAPKRSPIRNRSLPELIPVIHFYDIPAFGPETQNAFHVLNKSPTPHGDTICQMCPGM